MKLPKYFLLFCFLLLINACTKNIPFPDIQSEPLIVINSLVSPDTTVVVHISESCHIQNTNCEGNSISNASVILKDHAGMILANLEHTGDGIYSTSNYTLSPNVAYQLEVQQQGTSQSTITSSTKIPKPISSTFFGAEEGRYDGNTAWGFDIEIEDDPDEENYYLLHARIDILDGEHQENYSELNNYIAPHFGHYTNDPNTDNQSLFSGYDFIAYPLRHVYLSDKAFNGQKYRTRIGVVDRDIYRPEFEKFQAHIFVRSVSKEMYTYQKSLEAYLLSQGSIFAEPEQIYTNIEGGLGIFGGYTEAHFTTDLPKSEYIFPNDFSVENEGCIAPCVVKFSTDGGSKLNYSWDFGDGNTSTEPNPEHQYTASGNYNANLSIIDASVGGISTSNWGFEVVIN